MISQREARRLKKRADQLEHQINVLRKCWAKDPGGVYIGSIKMQRDALVGRIEGARFLRHAVVITEIGDGNLNIYALPEANI